MKLQGLCAAKHGSQALAAYQKIFDLLKTDTTPKAKDPLNTLASLSLEELLDVVLVVSGPPLHVEVLFEI